jgi:hypothetical protein
MAEAEFASGRYLWLAMDDLGQRLTYLQGAIGIGRHGGARPLVAVLVLIWLRLGSK